MTTVSNSVKKGNGKFKANFRPKAQTSQIVDRPADLNSGLSESQPDGNAVQNGPVNLQSQEVTSSVSENALNQVNPDQIESLIAFPLVENYEIPFGTFKEIVNPSNSAKSSSASTKPKGNIISIPQVSSDEVNVKYLDEVQGLQDESTFDVMKDLILDELVLRSPLKTKRTRKVKPKINEEDTSSAVAKPARKSRKKRSLDTPRAVEEGTSADPILTSEIDEGDSEMVDTEQFVDVDKLTLKAARRQKLVRDKAISQRIENYQGDKPISYANIPLSVLCRKDFSYGVALPGRENWDPKSDPTEVTAPTPTTNIVPAQAPVNRGGPKMKIVDGEIVIDEDSLIDNQDEQRLQEAMESDAVVVVVDDTNRITNYASHTNRDTGYGKKWSPEQTDKFYKGLEEYGLNFEEIALELFNNDKEQKRSGKQIKKKYMSEDKKNSARVTAALKVNVKRCQVEEPVTMPRFEFAADQTDQVGPPSSTVILENLEATDLAPSVVGTMPEVSKVNWDDDQEEIYPALPSVNSEASLNIDTRNLHEGEDMKNIEMDASEDDDKGVVEVDCQNMPLQIDPDLSVPDFEDGHYDMEIYDEEYDDIYDYDGE